MNSESLYKNYSLLAHEVFDSQLRDWFYDIHYAVEASLIYDDDRDQEMERKKAIELIKATSYLCSRKTFETHIPFEFKGYKLVLRKRGLTLGKDFIQSGLVVEFDPLLDDAA